MQFDLLCRVIDNFGDIGVCWRLAADLAVRGHAVRLWTDDASALAWMAPQGAPGVSVHRWPEAAPQGGTGDVVIEAFGCDIPEAFQAAIAKADARAQAARAPRPVWLNLEYLSAENYVQRCHRLPSPVMSGPARGLTRWFFYPGFTPATGGLLREAELARRQHAFDRHAWRARHGVAPGALAIALFCYEPPALGPWLAQLAPCADAHLLVTPGRAAAAIAHEISLKPLWENSKQLSITYLQPCPQGAFDEMLWAADLNLVRGEDSLVRALWAGQPFVWHIYPQHDDAHHAKLQAFLDWLQAPASLRRFHLLWNGVERAGALPAIDAATLAEWRDCTLAARARLLAQDDLLTQLEGFIREHR